MLKKAIVTGSAVGIGRAIALDLARQGFDIAFHYNRSVDQAQQATQEATEYGVKAVALQADITQPDRAQALVNQAAEMLGGLSVVVNNVGNYLEKRTSEITVQEWQEILDSNLNATFYITQAALPHLKLAGEGRIVNIGYAGSLNLTARNLVVPYAIAKTGIVIYSKSLAKELINDRITVNIVAPGVAENSVELDSFIPKIPAGRPASLAEVTYAVRFFVSEKSNYITGQTIEVSGGWSL